MRSTRTWSPIRRVFSIELEGMTKACSVKVMMNNPVTRTAAIEATNSGVVSSGFLGGDWGSASIGALLVVLGFETSSVVSFGFALAMVSSVPGTFCSSVNL